MTKDEFVTAYILARATAIPDRIEMRELVREAEEAWTFIYQSRSR